ncbi:MAG: outer membrane homotrimeric porin [Desulfovibrio sp.]
MKRFIMLALVAAFLLSSVCSASAADIKASGSWGFNALWMDKDLTKDSGDKAMDIQQRIRTTFEFVANENLKGVMEVEANTATWGQGTSAYSVRDALNLRQGYLDFNYPGTDVNVKVGKMIVTLPHAVGGSPIIGGNPANAAQISAPINDMFSAVAGYSRLLQSATVQEQFADLYYVAAPVTLDGVSFTPYFGYANIGDHMNNAAPGAAYAAVNALLGAGASSAGVGVADVDPSLSSFWIGTTFEMNMFDPFVVKADVTYGQTSADTEALETAGWFSDIALEYTGLDYMTPEMFLVYSTGLDDETYSTESGERMPIVNNDGGVGSFFFGGSAFMSGDCYGNSQIGYWAVGGSLKDIQFIEKLTHTFHLLYAEGTNDADAKNGAGASMYLAASRGNNIEFGRTLTDKDSIWEVDFNTSYALYDELTAILELGYVASDLDESVWGQDDEDAYKLGLGLQYSF